MIKRMVARNIMLAWKEPYILLELQRQCPRKIARENSIEWPWNQEGNGTGARKARTADEKTQS